MARQRCVGAKDGETGRLKEPEICHKTRRDLRAGFFWVESACGRTLVDYKT
jgi:hypothetical protein